MIAPRRRALEALMGTPPPEEVDVSLVPVDINTASEVPQAMPSVPEELTTGAPQLATERDYYGEALAQQKKNRLSSIGGQVGSDILKAFTGIGPSDETLAQRNEFIQQPVVEYLQRQKRADDERRLALTAAKIKAPGTKASGKPVLSTDPASPESKHMQEVFAATYPTRYTPEQLSKFSAADFAALKLPEKAPQLEGIEAKREGQVNTAKAAQARLEQGARQHVEEMGYKWEALSHTDQRAQMALEEARVYREQARADRQQDQLNTDVRGLGQDLEDLGGMRDDLATLRSGAIRSDIPGVGIIDSRKPGFMQGASDIAVRQAVRGIVSRLLKAQSGSTVSEQELDRKLEELGMGESATEAQFRIGLKRLERDVSGALEQREARHTPDAVNAYRQRGGVTSKDLPKPQRKPAPAALPPDASGQPTLESTTNPAKVQYSPSRDMTRELDSAGNVIREYKGRPNG